MLAGMNRHRPRTFTRRAVLERSDAEGSLPASPFAAFLLHRHSSRSEEGLPRANGDGSVRDAAGGRGRLAR